MVENALGGFDINRHAVQLAACNLTMGAPTVDYQEMNLFTLAHGPDGQGDVKLGSLEILPTSGDEINLASMVLPALSFDMLGARQVDESSEINFPHKNLDVVIMNPPFTAKEKRGIKFDEDIKDKMDARETWIKDQVENKDEQTIDVINHGNLRSFFTPLGNQLLNENEGTFATVVPATACIGASGLPERKFLAKRFQVELIVTSHDPKRLNFSGNTNIHESLLICRRADKGQKKLDTRFVSLRRNPRTATDAIDAADAIASGELGQWGNEFVWPAEKVDKGDWRPAAFYNPDLLAVLLSLESKQLVRLGEIAEVEPEGRRVRDAFNRHSNSDVAEATSVLWDHKTDIRTTMAAQPDTFATPIDEKQEYATNTLLPKASRLLIANRMYTAGVRTTSVLLEQPALGNAFIPVRPNSNDEATKRLLEKAFVYGSIQRRS